MGTSSAPTLTARVYDALRADVLAGRLAPGSRLRLVELAARFSVSQSVVREALARLSQQRLVVALPQQGFRVAPLSVEDLTRLTDARKQLEGLVLRLSVERGDVAWESAVVAAHHQLERTPMYTETGEPNEEWLASHEKFHAALLAGCGNVLLTELAEGLRESAALYRVWSVPIGHDYDRDLPQEHRELLAAVLDRDPDTAVELMHRHIQHTTDVLLSVADQYSATS
ncbi:GntR family transcriptional regulator [Amycolatopsis pithecellobii]|uniref:FCD domain-containing protein n=1 Tax=Amycolatopsis pithecellobii TaxID=664692 RepID=A0A6N7YTT6_9PSEU|nr:GntR family transcriptional regulator [Amycolatopsis pithecellobii]MTD56455.1 FCD domain-containing protein [Amycolatopsis pithecellobii]